MPPLHYSRSLPCLWWCIFLFWPVSHFFVLHYYFSDDLCMVTAPVPVHAVLVTLLAGTSDGELHWDWHTLPVSPILVDLASVSTMVVLVRSVYVHWDRNVVSPICFRSLYVQVFNKNIASSRIFFIPIGLIFWGVSSCFMLHHVLTFIEYKFPEVYYPNNWI